MSDDDKKPKPNADEAPAPTVKDKPTTKESGGRDGPEPTRYGDWEVNGICVDF